MNPATGEQREAIGFAPDQFGSNDVTFGGGFVWLGGSDGRLVRYDPRTGEDRTRMGLAPIDTIAFGHGSVWTVDTVGGTVTRYDPGTMRPVEEIVMPTAADYLVSGDVAVWALSTSVGTLSRIDPATNDVRYQVQVGQDPSGLAVGSRAVWVGDEDGIIRRVNEDTREVTRIPFGAESGLWPSTTRRIPSGSTSSDGRAAIGLKNRRPPRDAEKPGLRGPGFGLSAALVGVAGDAGSTYSVEPASSTGGVSGGMMPAPCSNVISPSSTSTMIVSPARNSL